MSYGFSLTSDLTDTLLENILISEDPSFTVLVSSISGKFIKMCVIITITFIFLYCFNHKDPFSNSDLFLKLQKNGHKADKFYKKELALISNYLPSNILGQICHDCKKREICKNAIPITTKRQISAWNKLFAYLAPADVSSWMRVTNDCRKAYYQKYGLLFAFSFLLLCYLCLNVYDFFLLSITLSMNLF